MPRPIAIPLRAPPARTRAAERGNTLLLSMIVLAVLGMLAAGALSMSGTELGAASAKRNYDNLVACARGGRELIMSGFSLSNASPQAMSAYLPGTAGKKLLIASGHLDSGATLPDKGTGPALTVQYKPPEQAGTARGAEDIANKILGGSGTQPANYTIVCEDPQTKRRYEIEFSVQFGF